MTPTTAPGTADGDGLSDAYELERRQAGVAYSPISCDTDLDGLADKQEMDIGSDPAKADSDNDGLKDGDEVWHLVYTIATANNVTTCTPTDQQRRRLGCDDQRGDAVCGACLV